MPSINRRDFLKQFGVGAAAVGTSLAFPTLLAGCSPASTGGGSSTVPIKIGALIDMSGPFSVYGTGMSNAINLAAKEINDAGGIVGRPVELLIEDAATDPKTSTEKATKFVQQTKVDLVIGIISSAVRDAVVPVICDRGNTLFIYPTLYEGGSCNPNLFSFGPTPPQQIEPYIPWLMTEKGNTFYCVGLDYVWPRTVVPIVRGLVEANGGQVLGEEFVPIGSTDLGAIVAKIKAANPKVVFSLASGPSLYAMARQMYDAGLMNTMTLATPFVDDSDTGGMPNEVAEGVLTSMTWYKSVDLPENKEWLEKAAAMFGADPDLNEMGVTLRNGMFLYADAVKRAGSTEVEAVRTALETARLDKSPQGPVSVENHHLVQNIYIGEIQSGRIEVIKTFEQLSPNQTCQN